MRRPRTPDQGLGLADPDDHVEAPDCPAALALLAPYVAKRTRAIAGRDVQIP